MSRVEPLELREQCLSPALEFRVKDKQTAAVTDCSGVTLANCTVTIMGRDDPTKVLVDHGVLAAGADGLAVGHFKYVWQAADLAEGKAGDYGPPQIELYWAATGRTHVEITDEFPFIRVLPHLGTDH